MVDVISLFFDFIFTSYAFFFLLDFLTLFI